MSSSKYRSNDDDEGISKTTIIAATVGLTVIGTGLWIASRFKVVPANQFMAKTGFLVDKVHVSRKTIQWPFQVIKKFDMHPLTYQFTGTNIMSKEMIGFELPVKFNIAPIHPDDNHQGFVNYATRVGGMTSDEVHALIENIIIGKTREFTSNMTIEDIVRDKNAFKKGVVAHIEAELEENGFKATSANISDIKDPPGVDYFKNLMRKATSEANSTSSIAVAEAEKTRIVGEKDREVETRKQQSTLEATAKEVESKQNQNVSEYERDLKIMRTNNKQKERMAEIEAHQVTQMRQIEVESKLNFHKQQQELEKLRSEKVIKATAEAEAVLKTAQMEADAVRIKAEARATAVKIGADADLFEKTRKAEADLIAASKKAEADLYTKTRDAEADFITKTKEADAALFARTKEADGVLFYESKKAEATKLTAEADLVAQRNHAIGVQANLEAQAEGLRKMYETSHENPEMATFYLAIKEGGIFKEGGLFDNMGKHQAAAINGLQPKIHIWNTGADAKNPYTDVISSLVKTSPPLLDVLQQQTGIKLPSWVPGSSSGGADAITSVINKMNQQSIDK
jgi:flotillin